MSNSVSTLFPHMKNRVGLFLCTKGEAVLSNVDVMLVKRGTLAFFGPVLDYQVVSHSQDFELQHISATSEDSLFDTFQDLRRLMAQQKILSLNVDIPEDGISQFLNVVDKLSEMEKNIAAEQNFARKALSQKLYAVYMTDSLIRIFLDYFDCVPLDYSLDNQVENVLIPMKFVRLANREYKERSVSYFAEKLGVPVGQLNRLVRAYYNKTPHDLISGISINIAKSLLRQRALCLKEIAAELNFPDQSTFQRFFKNNAGMTPKEYQDLVYRKANEK